MVDEVLLLRKISEVEGYLGIKPTFINERVISLLFPRDLREKYHLNPASAESAGDARRQGRRCIRILQVLVGAADSAKSALPEGKLFSKNPSFFVAFKLMHVKSLQRFNKPLVIQL